MGSGFLLVSLPNNWKGIPLNKRQPCVEAGRRGLLQTVQLGFRKPHLKRCMMDRGKRVREISSQEPFLLRSRKINVFEHEAKRDLDS